MENLGKLADGSGGKVNVVDPLSLHKEFASILSESIIATNVSVDFFLHKGIPLSYPSPFPFFLVSFFSFFSFSFLFAFSFPILYFFPIKQQRFTFPQ